MNNELAGCARCPIEPQDRLCQKENGKSPKYCPTLKNEEAITKSQLEMTKKQNSISSWVCASVMILYF
jgi:hypothetical protein